MQVTFLASLLAFRGKCGDDSFTKQGFMDTFIQFCDGIHDHEEEGIQYFDQNLFQFVVIKNVFSESETQFIIDEAESYAEMKAWTTDRHAYYPTTDISSFDIPMLNFFMLNTAYRRVIPVMEHVYHLAPNQLGLEDSFIAKYEFGDGKQNRLKKHTDNSEFSFVVALNDDFEGGGTSFKNRVIRGVEKSAGMGYNYTIYSLKYDNETDIESKKSRRVHFHAERGDVLLFCGKHKHEGVKVTKGIRYIWAGFCNLLYPNACENMMNFEVDRFEKAQDPFACYNDEYYSKLMHHSSWKTDDQFDFGI